MHLTPIEYRLLGILAAHAGRVVTTPQLLREVWGPSHAERGHYLRIYMGHLRQKLEDDPAQPQLPADGDGGRLSPGMLIRGFLCEPACAGRAAAATCRWLLMVTGVC